MADVGGNDKLMGKAGSRHDRVHVFLLVEAVGALHFRGQQDSAHAFLLGLPDVLGGEALRLSRAEGDESFYRDEAAEQDFEARHRA